MSTHLSVEPAILYLGTPVVLVSSTNEDGPQISPPCLQPSGWAGGTSLVSRWFENA